MCVSSHKAEDQAQRKFVFMMKWASKWDLRSSGEIIVSLGDFNGHVLRVLKVYTGGNGIGKQNAEGRLLEFCDEKELSVANTWFYKTDKRKITNSTGECETEIDFVLVGEKYGCESDSIKTSAQTGGRRSIKRY